LEEKNLKYEFMRLWTVTWMALVACLIEPFSMRCEAQANVMLTWNPSVSSGVASYNVCWGTNSGIYIYTNNFAFSTTTATITISDAATNEVFYFAVQAVGSNGLASAFSNEQGYTNGPPSNLPPPPGGGTNTNPPIVVNPPGGGTTNTNAGSFTASTNLMGVPPYLGLAVSNGQVNLTINGTVGALLDIVGSTNDLSLNEWSAITNLTLTNISSVAATNQQGQPQDLLSVAYVPGVQSVPVAATNAGRFQYFQVVMPYDYAILADQALLANTNATYSPRLIVVSMPGDVDDVCYVNQFSSFVHYTRTNSALQLYSSGSTIRQIANTLAGSLNLDWTSASEFTYSNGMGQVLATVIETEPPSSDPVAGQNPPSAPIVINF
jgi:hypothetical protein